MALSVVGTPLAVASGGSYTPEAGSNRLVVVVVRWKGVGAPTLNNVVYNSVTRTATVQLNEASSRVAEAICIFKESELPAGAATVTSSWTVSPSAQSIMCYTVQDADQSTTVRNSASNSASGTTPSVAVASIAVGDLVISGCSNRSGAGGAGTIGNSFTKDDDFENGDGGRFVSAHKTAVATTETFSIVMPDADNWAAAGVALIPAAGGGISIPVVAAYQQMMREM